MLDLGPVYPTRLEGIALPQQIVEEEAYNISGLERHYTVPLGKLECLRRQVLLLILFLHVLWDLLLVYIIDMSKQAIIIGSSHKELPSSSLGEYVLGDRDENDSKHCCYHLKDASNVTNEVKEGVNLPLVL